MAWRELKEVRYSHKAKKLNKGISDKLEEDKNIDLISNFNVLIRDSSSFKPTRSSVPIAETICLFPTSDFNQFKIAPKKTCDRGNDKLSSGENSILRGSFGSSRKGTLRSTSSDGVNISTESIQLNSHRLVERAQQLHQILIERNLDHDILPKGQYRDSKGGSSCNIRRLEIEKVKHAPKTALTSSHNTPHPIQPQGLVSNYSKSRKSMITTENNQHPSPPLHPFHHTRNLSNTQTSGKKKDYSKQISAVKEMPKSVNATKKCHKKSISNFEKARKCTTQIEKLLAMDVKQMLDSAKKTNIVSQLLSELHLSKSKINSHKKSH